MTISPSETTLDSLSCCFYVGGLSDGVIRSTPTFGWPDKDGTNHDYLDRFGRLPEE